MIEFNSFHVYFNILLIPSNWIFAVGFNQLLFSSIFENEIHSESSKFSTEILFENDIIMYRNISWIFRLFLLKIFIQQERYVNFFSINQLHLWCFHLIIQRVWKRNGETEYQIDQKRYVFSIHKCLIFLKLSITMQQLLKRVMRINFHNEINYYQHYYEYPDKYNLNSYYF